MEMCQAPGDSGVIGRDILQYRETAQLSSTVMSQLISFTREDNFRGSAADAFAELAGRQGANLYSVATKLETVADALYSYNESLVYWQGMIESVLRDFASTEAEIQKAHHKQDEVAAQYPGLVGVALHAIAGYAAWHRQAEELVSLSQTLTNKYVQFAVEIAAAALIAANKIDAVSTFEPLDVVVDLWTFATNREHEFEHWLDENTNAILAVLGEVDGILSALSVVAAAISVVAPEIGVPALLVLSLLTVGSSAVQFGLTHRAIQRGLTKESGDKYDATDGYVASFSLAISVASVFPAFKAFKAFKALPAEITPKLSAGVATYRAKEAPKIAVRVSKSDRLRQVSDLLAEHGKEIVQPALDDAYVEVVKGFYDTPYFHTSFNHVWDGVVKVFPVVPHPVPAMISIVAQ
jgi:hypothetical protein